MSTSQHILILSSDTGGGHRSAALALEDSLHATHTENIMVKTIRVLEDSSPFTRVFSDFYNYLLQHKQEWMKYYYWMINRFRFNESPFLLNEALRHGYKTVERFAPTAIVSVHPMTQHFASFVLKRLGLKKKIPIITVVTDPCDGFWQGWACEDVDYYFVASEAAKNQLIEYGIQPERISIEGMPVHTRFTPVSKEEKRALRAAYGLSPDTFTLFMNAGAYGGGNIYKLYKALLTHRSTFSQPLQIIFLAGGNNTLENKAKKLADSLNTQDTPIQVYGYSNDIHHLMNISDIMVSKLGGLTTFEAIACHLPILGDALTEPMPQEKQTARLIEAGNLGRMVDSPENFLNTLNTLMVNQDELSAIKNACKENARASAADRIAQRVIEAIATSSDSMISRN